MMPENHLIGKRGKHSECSQIEHLYEITSESNSDSNEYYCKECYDVGHAHLLEQ